MATVKSQLESGFCVQCLRVILPFSSDCNKNIFSVFFYQVTLCCITKRNISLLTSCTYMHRKSYESQSPTKKSFFLCFKKNYNIVAFCLREAN